MSSDEVRPALLGLSAAVRHRALTVDQEEALIDLFFALDRARLDARVDSVPQWAPVQDAYAALLALIKEGS